VPPVRLHPCPEEFPLLYLPETNLETALTLMSAIDGRSHFTAGRTRAVARIATALAEPLGCTEGDLQRLQWACIYYDLGMLSVPEHVILKPGTLGPTELQQLRGHVHLSLQLLADSPAPVPIADLVAAHHERYDGGGYPRGLRGYDLPLLANILNAADTLVALASDRPHRRGFDAAAIAEIIRAERGRQFYPHIVDAFENLDLAALLPERSAVQPVFEARQIHIAAG